MMGSATLHDDLVPQQFRDDYARVFVEIFQATESLSFCLRSVVNRVEAKLKTQQAPHHAIMMFLVTSFVDHIDGISLLAKHGAAHCIHNHLRSALELYLQVEYMIDEDYERRARTYQFWHNLQELQTCEYIDPTTQKGISLRAEMSSDVIGPEVLEDIAAATDATSTHQKILAVLYNPKYAPFYAEYKRSTHSDGSKRGKPKHWYSMWDGPCDLRALAKKLNKLTFYVVYYKSWCKTVHGENSLDRLIDEQGQVAHTQAIRSPINLGMCMDNTMLLAQMMCSLLIGKFHEEMRPMYVDEYFKVIKPKFERLKRFKFKEHQLEIKKDADTE